MTNCVFTWPGKTRHGILMYKSKLLGFVAWHQGSTGMAWPTELQHKHWVSTAHSETQAQHGMTAQRAC
jgi:hypothetical protein